MSFYVSQGATIKSSVYPGFGKTGLAECAANLAMEQEAGFSALLRSGVRMRPRDRERDGQME
jgi:hypothetical protein